VELLINDSVLRIRNWNIGAPTPIQATGKLASTMCTRLLEFSFHGSVEYFMSIGHRCFRTATDISEGECSKKFVQQGRSRFDARSVLPVREHGKMARTPLAVFFNISHLATIHQQVETYDGPNGSAVQVGPLRQTTDGPGRLGTVWRNSQVLNYRISSVRCCRHLGVKRAMTRRTLSLTCF